MSGRNGPDLEMYGLNSVDSEPSNSDKTGYDHELIFKENIDLPTMVNIAQKMGFTIEFDPIESSLLHIKRGSMGRKKAVRVYGNSIMYTESEFSELHANKLIFNYGMEKLGWDPKDNGLRSIMDCD